ncbi:MAG: peptidylprolyl isomerase [Actinobacteria bacterium]|nr:peptidylprolyl isomerase [Actinomycetota bacterium]
MEDNKENKDLKDLLNWDEDNGQTEKIEKPVQKKSKKVLKREAKELEKKKRLEIINSRRKSRLNKKARILIIAGAAIAAVAVIIWVLFGYFGIGIDLTRTIARADDLRVSAAELNEYMEFIKNQNPESIPPEDDEQYTVIKQNILDSLIVLKVIESYAQKNGMIVSQQDIDAEYEKVIASYPSEDDFYKDLKDKKISMSFFDKQIVNQIMRDRIFLEVAGGISVSEDEAVKYYEDNTAELFTVPEQVKVSHILVKFNIPEGGELNDAVRKEAKDKILDIEKQLADGGDFAELAKKYSDDTASAQNGGDIGFISTGQTVPEFEEAAFALSVGQYSSPIETYYGYHLITVTEKNEAYIKTYEEVKETINNYLLSNKQMEAWQDFIFDLIENTNIEYKTSLKGQLLEQK